MILKSPFLYPHASEEWQYPTLCGKWHQLESRSDAPCDPPDRQVPPPVRANRTPASKHLIQMELSRMARTNLSAEAMIHPIFPLLQGRRHVRQRSDRAPGEGWAHHS